MMTTNLFVIANVKQLRTDGSFRILLPFFRTSWGVGVLNSANFNSFHNRVEFGTILEDLRNFGEGFDRPIPTLVRHWLAPPLSRVARYCSISGIGPHYVTINRDVLNIILPSCQVEFDAHIQRMTETVPRLLPNFF